MERKKKHNKYGEAKRNEKVDNRVLSIAETKIICTCVYEQKFERIYLTKKTLQYLRVSKVNSNFRHRMPMTKVEAFTHLGPTRITFEQTTSSSLPQQEGAGEDEGVFLLDC